MRVLFRNWLLIGVSWLIFTACSAERGSRTIEERLADFPKSIPNLKESVSIYWDSHAVPYIEANNDHDLALALGMVHAHLRLGQMEFVRHLSQGRLSEMAGPFMINVDKTIRAIGISDASKRIYEQMNANTRSWLDTFVEGINFYQDRLKELPWDLRLAGIQKERWSATDLITMSRLVGADVNWLVWYQLLPLMQETRWPKLWERLLRRNGEGVVSFNPGNNGEAISSYSRSGSNSMVLSSRLTGSGFPIIASDPHVGFQLPNLWLIAAIRSPNINAVGLMFPGLPAVLIGRNKQIAFGATNMRALSSTLSRLKGEENVFEQIQDIKVRFWPDVEYHREVSSLGPIISEAPLIKKLGLSPMALRWVGHESSDELTAILKMDRASNFNEFKEAFDTYAVSGQNYLYADSRGNIGEVMAVKLPKLSSDISKSITMDSEIEWQGYYDVSSLPYAYNPKEGYLISANNAPCAKSSSENSSQVGLFYSSNDRYQRLTMLVKQANGELSRDVVSKIQTDVLVPSALEVRDRMISIAGSSSDGVFTSDEKELLEFIGSWNGEYLAESRGALGFELMEFYFAKEVFEEKYGEKISNYLLGSDSVHQFLLEEIAENKNDLSLVSRFKEALKIATKDFEKYSSWGDFHRLRLTHSFSSIPVIGRLFIYDEYKVPGTSGSVWKTWNGLTNERHYARYGANARHISDLSDEDENYFVLLGGQDGDSGSKQFLDLAPLWLRGEYIKVPLRVETAKAQATEITVLQPGS